MLCLGQSMECAHRNAFTNLFPTSSKAAAIILPVNVTQLPPAAAAAAAYWLLLCVSRKRRGGKHFPA